MSHLRTLLFTAAALVAGTTLCAQSGAIFTTDKFGDSVNGNKYGKTSQVYLRTAGILPDGDYVFQVTNTSGTVLLSEDGTANRTVTITGGIITDAGDHSLGNEGHGKKGDPNVVQLAPFSQSGNGQYKVWLTAQSALVAGGYHGFVPSASKTDNFKVEKGKPVVKATITGFKFYDLNQNEAQDGTEFGLSGWRIELREKDNTTLLGFTFTDENGQYSFPGLPLDGTQYEVSEVAPIFEDEELGTVASDQGFIGQAPGARWLAITERSGTTAPVLTEAVVGPNFGNVYFVKAEVGAGTAFEVHDKGWWHSVHGEDQLDSCPGWQDILNTIDNPFDIVPDVSSAPQWSGLIACLEAASVPVKLSRSSPVASDWIFTATTFDPFSDWIVGEALGHSAFKLSREIAAALLNIKCGGLSTTTVYINPTGDEDLLNLVLFDEMAYQAICVLLNNPLAFDTGPTPSTAAAATLKAAIEGCLNEFGGINTSGSSTETLSFVYAPETDSTGVFDPSQPYGPGTGA